MDDFETNLNASLLQTPTGIYSKTEFEKLLDGIYRCYKGILFDNIKLPENDENKIRDVLLQYLNNNLLRVKYGLLDFLFDPEVPVNNGRSDIKVQTQNTFQNTQAYYILECKRLNGYAHLNKEYKKNGIDRFLIGKYPVHPEYKINGMIGFIIKEIDIDKNIHKIGNFFDRLEKDKLYQSTHHNVKLYHLMLNFSKNIYQKSKT